MKIITTAEDSAEACKVLGQQPAAWDVETCGVLGTEDFCILMLAATNGGEVYVWGPVEGPVRGPVVEWLASNAPKFGHNVKYDMAAVRAAWGVEVRGIVGDTMLMHKLLHDDRPCGLDALSGLVGMAGYKGEFAKELEKAKKLITKVRGKRGGQIELMADNQQQPLVWARKYKEEDWEKFAYGLVPKDVLSAYCATDSVTTWKLFNYLTEEMKGDCGVSHVWRQIVLPATEAIARVEARGVLVDQEALGKFSAHVAAKRDEMGNKLRDVGILNPNSSKQVASYLFGVVGLEPVKMNSTGPSTDVHTLRMLRQQHPVVEQLLEYRRLDKLSVAYGQSLANYIGQDGRIHPEFRIDGARTGRMSCRNPGLHQIPKRSEEAKMLKDCFVCAPGHVLIQADYSQLEIRIAAMLSQDEIMLEQLKSGVDFHLATARKIARQMWKIEPDAVTKVHRDAAKTVIFGLIYGKTDSGLAKDIRCSKMDAYNLRRAILGEFAGLARWSEFAINQAKESGYSRTWWMGREARRRHITGFEKAGWYGQQACNQAVNSPVQGTASDFCLASVVSLVEKDIPVVMTVHDSIIVECGEADVPATVRVMKEVMEQWPSNGVPIVVDVEVGQRWGSLTKLQM